MRRAVGRSAQGAKVLRHENFHPERHDGATTVERFTALALGQFKAELHGETGKYNRLFRERLPLNRS